MRKRALAALAATALAVLVPSCAAQNQEWHRACKVTGKDTLYSSSEGNSKREYRLSTSCGPFTVEDALSVGQFNSWDIWQKLEEGQTYDIKTGGYRIGILSTFPTVIEVVPVG